MVPKPGPLMRAIMDDLHKRGDFMGGVYDDPVFLARWAEINAQIERVARAICVADGCDPDAIGYGLGIHMPKDAKYPLWKARVKQAEAAIAAMPTDAAR